MTDATLRSPVLDDLQAEVKTRETELRQALQRLERRARRQVDPKRLMKDHASALLGGAFIVGLWLGLRSRPWSRHGRY